MKKILCIFAASVALCAASVPSVWAMPIDDTGDAVTPAVEALEPVDEVVDADTVIDVTDPDTGDRMTVDISEESIEQIATAVLSASNSVSYVTDYEIVSGFFLPSDFVFSRDTVVLKTSLNNCVYSSPDGVTRYTVSYEVDGYYKTWFNVSSTTDGLVSRFCGSSSTDEMSFRYMGGGTAIDTSVVDDPVLWSNVDVYSADGNVIHSADFVKPVEPSVFNVSFVTGIDGYTFPSQSSNNLTLPVPSYEGYVFHGWFLDADFSAPYTSDYVFTADTTLYAKFEPLPEMAFFHGVIFDAFDVLFSCEPILYILALMFTVIIIGVIRKLVVTRC